MSRFIAFIAAMSIVIPLASAQEVTTPAPTPPMGWNSWNYHGKQNINEEVVRETIDAIVDSGLRDAGYVYVVVDGGWRARELFDADGTVDGNAALNDRLIVSGGVGIENDKDGQLVPHPEKFPNGIKPLADYAHAQGLKFGLHTVPGSHDCGGDAVGGMGWEEIHIDQFVEWGVDFVKVDKCILKSKWTEPLVQETYEKWNNLLCEADRDIVLSISAYEWRDWYPETCQMSRTTYDIHCRIHRGGAMFDTPSRHSVMAIAEKNNEVADLAGDGYWNDPDMIITGDHGLTFEEQKSHFALWCIMSAPLMLGNDPRNMTDEEKGIVLNPDCIAIDQDPTEQGHRIQSNGDIEIWAKHMTEDRIAVLLLNRNEEETRSIAFNPDDVGVTGSYSVKDVYGERDHLAFSGPIVRETLPHGCHLLILTPTPINP
jgi:alpha-galactosidase